MSQENSGSKPWWATLPAILAALAGVIAAITALLQVVLPCGLAGIVSGCSPNRPLPPPTVTSAAPTAAPKFRLEIIVDPSQGADFVLNPKPDASGAHEAGTTVTIEILPRASWRIDQWAGPVYAKVGNTSKVNMDSDKTVVVRLTQN